MDSLEHKTPHRLLKCARFNRHLLEIISMIHRRASTVINDISMLAAVFSPTLVLLPSTSTGAGMFLHHFSTVAQNNC